MTSSNSTTYSSTYAPGNSINTSQIGLVNASATLITQEDANASYDDRITALETGINGGTY